MSVIVIEPSVFEDLRSDDVVFLSKKSIEDIVQQIVTAHSCFSEAVNPSGKFAGNHHARFPKRNHNRKWIDSAPPSNTIKNLRLSCANEFDIDVNSYKLLTNSMNILSDSNLSKVSASIAKILTVELCPVLLNLIYDRCHNETKFIALYSQFICDISSQLDSGVAQSHQPVGAGAGAGVSDALPHTEVSVSVRDALHHVLKHMYNSWSYVSMDLSNIVCGCPSLENEKCVIHEYDNLCKQGAFRNKKTNFFGVLNHVNEKIPFGIHFDDVVHNMKDQIEAFLEENEHYIWFQVELIINQLKQVCKSMYNKDEVKPFLTYLSTLPIRNKTRFMLMDMFHL